MKLHLFILMFHVSHRYINCYAEQTVANGTKLVSLSATYDFSVFQMSPSNNIIHLKHNTRFMPK